MRVEGQRQYPPRFPRLCRPRGLGPVGICDSELRGLVLGAGASDFDLLKGGNSGTHVEYRLAASERGRKALDVAIA